MQKRSVEAVPASNTHTETTHQAKAVAGKRHDKLTQMATEINGSARMLAQRRQIAQLGGLVVPRPGKKEKVPLQGKFAEIQLKTPKKKTLQGQFATQSKAPKHQHVPVQKQAGPAKRSGLPPQLKSGIEQLSGHAMDDVKVHYNSSMPAQLQALAYAQGSTIHLAPGQEQHLPHEAWHVVQQKQGRVQATTQLQGYAVNDSPALEHEADVMGAKAGALGLRSSPAAANHSPPVSGPLQRVSSASSRAPVIQNKTEIAHTASHITVQSALGATHHEVGHKMVAKLDVNDPVVGTATGPNWTWMQALRAVFPSAGVVRGHLLNHDLGGFAIPANLYPISTLANANHSSQVEQKVKGMLNHNDAKTHRISYMVEVKEHAGANNPALSSFNCTWGWENNPLTTVPILSNLGKDQGGFGGVGAIAAHPNWHHGKGKGGTNQYGKTAATYVGAKNLTGNSISGNVALTGNVEASYKPSQNEAVILQGENFARAVHSVFVNLVKNVLKLNSYPPFAEVLALVKNDDDYLVSQKTDNDLLNAVHNAIDALGIHNFK